MEKPKTLRAARKAAGLTQVQLSKRTAITQTTISKIEQRYKPLPMISAREARRLFRVLGVEPHEVQGILVREEERAAHD